MALLNLSSLFRSTLFGWCIPIYSNIFTYGNIIFDLRPCFFFLEKNEGVKRALGVYAIFVKF